MDPVGKYLEDHRENGGTLRMGGPLRIQPQYIHLILVGWFRAI